MKTLPELQSTPLPQLKAIATALAITFHPNIGQAKLANIVFNAQQPDQDQLKQDEVNSEDAKAEDEEAAKKRQSGEEEVDAMLTELETFFEGTIEETAEDDSNGTVFAINDMAGEVIVQGTYVELVTKKEEIERIKAAEAFESAKNLKAAQQPIIDPSELSIPERGTPAPAAPEGWHKQVEEQLNPFKKLGLKFHTDNDTVYLHFANRELTTTIHQPLHRIVRTAEALVTRQ